MSPVPLAAVVYAKDLDRLAGFYEGLLGWSVLASSPGGFVCLAPTDGSAELSVVAARPEVAAGLVVADPPERRSSTPMKWSFLVTDLAAARARAAELGGVVDPPEREWTWRDLVHCDGHDPEGNIFQLRVPAS